MPAHWLSEARTWFDIWEPAGDDPDDYTVRGRVPGAIRMANGSEALKFGTAVSVGMVVVTMRHGVHLKATWKLITLDGRSLQIAAYADPDGHRRWCEVLCTEIYA